MTPWDNVFLVNEAVDWVPDVLVGCDQKAADHDQAGGDLGVDGEHERLNMVVVVRKVLKRKPHSINYKIAMLFYLSFDKNI